MYLLFVSIVRIFDSFCFERIRIFLVSAVDFG